MASSVITGKRVILVFEEGTYSFRNIDPAATPQAMYGLGVALNAFQSEKPPVKILQAVTREIL
jgi:hypothetical protein